MHVILMLNNILYIYLTCFLNAYTSRAKQTVIFLRLFAGYENVLFKQEPENQITAKSGVRVVDLTRKMQIESVRLLARKQSCCGPFQTKRT